MTQDKTLSTRVVPAEWEPQDAIVVAWPHRDTDWVDTLDEAEECYKKIAAAIVSEMRLIVVAPSVEDVKPQLGGIDHSDRIIYQQIETNDTWARDFGPISVIDHGERVMLDFKFDAWGMKFAACHDNLICRKLWHNGIFDARLENCQDFVLEGGSIESDGHGTLLTTSKCLLSPNRNAWLSKDEIEKVLSSRLGAKKVLWVESGELEGDDTDAHIDTLARLAPDNTILYVKCDDRRDPQHHSLARMEEELRAMTNAQGEPFNLVALPCPTAIHDEQGNRLPATYANFLITGSQVLVPTYGQPAADAQALAAIQSVFSSHRVVGIDCNALIKQHGSLHCVTMQIPKNFLKI